MATTGTAGGGAAQLVTGDAFLGFGDSSSEDISMSADVSAGGGGGGGTGLIGAEAGNGGMPLSWGMGEAGDPAGEMSSIIGSGGGWLAGGGGGGGACRVASAWLGVSPLP